MSTSLEYLNIDNKGYIRFKQRLCKYLNIRVLKRYYKRKCFIERKLFCKTIRGNVAERTLKNGTKIRVICNPQACSYSDNCNEYTLIKSQIYNDMVWIEIKGHQDIFEGANYRLIAVPRNNKAFPKLVIW